MNWMLTRSSVSSSRTFMPRGPITRRRRFPSANSPPCWASASPSSVIQNSIPHAAFLRACASAAMADPRFLLIRLGSLGDIIHALPAASALRDAFPEARIDWAVEPRWARLLEENPDISEVISVDRKSAAGIAATVRRLRSAKYTCAVDFQALYKSAI